MDNKPKFNLSLEEAIAELEIYAEKNSRQTREGIITHQLEGMSLDDAYDVGYATLLHDLKSLTGPNPMEVELISIATDGFEKELGPIPPAKITFLEEDNA